MIHSRNSEPPAGSRRRAFTLIEIVVSLTIIAVIAAVAIPTLKGINQDEKAREPIKTLADVVQQVRERAMRERRSYQMVFEHDGIHASPAMYPYEKREEFLKHLEELRMPPRVDPAQREGVQQMGVDRQQIANGSRPQQEPAAAEPEEPPVEAPWTVTIPLALETECQVLMWGDGEWDVLDGDKMRRWVFQPSGMASPARIRLRTGAAEREAEFDLLTGELTGERTGIASSQP